MRGKSSSKGKIVWTNKNFSPAAPFANLPKYVQPKVPRELERYLTIGSMWIATYDLTVSTRNWKLPIITAWSLYDSAIPLIKKTSNLIYAGTIRTEELESNGRVINAIRHTFIASNSRAILFNFNLLVPVDENYS